MAHEWQRLLRIANGRYLNIEKYNTWVPSGVNVLDLPLEKYFLFVRRGLWGVIFGGLHRFFFWGGGGFWVCCSVCGWSGFVTDKMVARVVGVWHGWVESWNEACEALWARENKSIYRKFQES